MVASNGVIHEEMLRTFEEIFNGRGLEELARSPGVPQVDVTGRSNDRSKALQ